VARRPAREAARLHHAVELASHRAQQGRLRAGEHRRQHGRDRGRLIMRRDSVPRRTILGGIAAAAATLAVGRARAADTLQTSAVVPGATLLAGAGGNILAVATDAGQIVVDSGAASAREAVLAALDTLPGGHVAALFNTHWHLDQ